VPVRRVQGEVLGSSDGCRVSECLRGSCGFTGAYRGLQGFALSVVSVILWWARWQEGEEGMGMSARARLAEQRAKYKRDYRDWHILSMEVELGLAEWPNGSPLMPPCPPRIVTLDPGFG